MEKSISEKPASRWLNVPIIALIARLLCRELTLPNESLRQENKLLQFKIKKRIVFTEEERRTLVEAAMAMGQDLMEQKVTIVKPETILASPAGSIRHRMNDGTTLGTASGIR